VGLGCWMLGHEGRCGRGFRRVGVWICGLHVLVCLRASPPRRFCSGLFPTGAASPPHPHPHRRTTLFVSPLQAVNRYYDARQAIGATQDGRECTDVANWSGDVAPTQPMPAAILPQQLARCLNGLNPRLGCFRPLSFTWSVMIPPTPLYTYHGGWFNHYYTKVGPPYARPCRVRRPIHECRLLL
jgi:hypothetical protein